MTVKYVFDLDGTICSQESYGMYHMARPINRMIKRMRQLHADGHTVVIFTARGMETWKGDVVAIEKDLRKLTEDWLLKWNVPYDQLIFGKPSADVYVDDKGIQAFDFV